MAEHVSALRENKSHKADKKLYFHCVECKQKLWCPYNATIVECTACNAVCMPFSEYVVECLECHHKLHHPPSAQIIQCSNPLCRCLMDVSQNPAQRCHMSAAGKIQSMQSSTELQSAPECSGYRSAFECFVAHEKGSNAKCNKRILQQLHMQWETMNVSQRAPYMAQSDADRKRYFEYEMNGRMQNDSKQTVDTTHIREQISMTTSDVLDRNLYYLQPKTFVSAPKIVLRQVPKPVQPKPVIVNKRKNVTAKMNSNVNEWQLNEIWNWLKAIGMEKYIELLQPQWTEDGIVGSDLKDISDLDLKDYGVRDNDDREWILQNIKQLS